MQDFLASAGISKDAYRFTDGSGLSRGTLVSPAAAPGVPRRRGFLSPRARTRRVSPRGLPLCESPRSSEFLGAHIQRHILKYVGSVPGM